MVFTTKKKIPISNGSDDPIFASWDIDRSKVVKTNINASPPFIGQIGGFEIQKDNHHLVDSGGMTKIMPGHTTEARWDSEKGTVFVSIYYEKDTDSGSKFKEICEAFPVKLNEGIVVSRDNTVRNVNLGKEVKQHKGWVDINGIDHFREPYNPEADRPIFPTIQEKSNGDIILTRFKDVSGPDLESNKHFGIKFAVNRPVEIIGFGLYGTRKGTRTTYDCWAQIYNHTQQSPLIEMPFQGCQNSPIIPLYFSNPVEVQPGQSYSAVALCQGTIPTFSGEDGLERVDCETSKGSLTFEFMRDPWYQGERGHTPLESGQLPQIFFRMKENVLKKHENVI